MPGLFDPNQSSGILSALGNLFASAQRGASGPAGQEMGFRQGAYNSMAQDPMFGPGPASLLMANPQAYGAAIGQRNLQMTIDALTPTLGRERAIFFGLHPEELSKLTAPQKVGPGEQLQAPLNLLGDNNPQPVGQATAPQPSQVGNTPQATPGQGGGMGGGYIGPMNTSGQMDQPSLQNLVDRRLKGDTKVNSELGGSLGSGIGALNRAAFQKLLAQTQAAQGITSADLVSRDAKFPAYEDALKTNAQQGARMQMAQTEALGMLPLLKQAAAATNPSQFPLFNAAKLQVLAQGGDPRSASLASYANALINTYSRGISVRGQGPTDADKQHLRDIVDPYWSKGQWEAGAQAIENELGIAHAAVGKNQNRIDVQFGFGKEADPNSLTNAKGAIAKGASKDLINRRFEEEGFNAPKF